LYAAREPLGLTDISAELNQGWSRVTSAVCPKLQIRVLCSCRRLTLNGRARHKQLDAVWCEVLALVCSDVRITDWRARTKPHSYWAWSQACRIRTKSAMLDRSWFSAIAATWVLDTRWLPRLNHIRRSAMFLMADSLH